ncbi:MAG: hypothetical protein KJZ65_03210 [Phycisphaerales bacterium]|nr:hypothetical protein [Phycisphaerales bacterium]
MQIGPYAAILALMFSVPQQTDPPSRAAIEQPLPHLALAFYYPWYGRPAGASRSTDWVHWSGVDEIARAIASSTNYPTLGPYDSHDPGVIEQHCAWAKQVGIDGFVVSWWGRDSFEDRAVPAILDAAAAHDLKISIYIEKVPRGQGLAAAPPTASEIRWITDTYGRHPAFLRLDDRPVLFAYVRLNQQLTNAGWDAVFARLRGQDETQPLIIADRPPEPIAANFDGWHTYDPMGQIFHERARFDSLDAWATHTFPNWMSRGRAHNGITCVTICPGYDDRYFRSPGVFVPRDQGQTYRTLWQRAIAAGPDWILITSFNEWHESSEIEPSDQHGPVYLDITREMTAKWKASHATARTIFREAIAVLSTRALGRERIDWSALEAELCADLRDTDPPSAAYPAIDAALARYHDPHARFQPASPPAPAPDHATPVSPDAPDSPPGAHPPADAPAPAPSPHVPAMPEARLLDDGIAYLVIPGCSAAHADDLRAFALALANELAHLHAQSPSGYLIDLRLNAGGNLWPMLLGLHPLLGDGPALTMIDANQHASIFGLDARSTWIDFGQGHQTQLDWAAITPPQTPSLADVRVAVLLGPWTMSSGEALAITLGDRPHTRTFGEPTAGLTTVTNDHPLSDGSRLIIPETRMGDRNARAVIGPVTPQQPAPFPDWPTADDPAATAARAWLLNNE